MKNLILLIAFFAISTLAFAQSQENKFLMPNNLYSASAVLTIKDSNKVLCSELNIPRDSISNYNLNRKLQESIALSELNHLQVTKGNYGLEGAVLGCFAFQSYTLLFGIEDNSPFNCNKYGTIIGSALLGVGVGYVVGLMIPKWKTYYFNSKK